MANGDMQEGEITELSVIAAIQNGTKVTAIKELRRLRGIGLKEVKVLVDEYCSQNNISDSSVQQVSSGGFLTLIAVIALLVILFFVFFK